MNVWQVLIPLGALWLAGFGYLSKQMSDFRRDMIDGDTRLDAKIDSLDGKLFAQVDSLNNKIDSLRVDLSGRIDRLTDAYIRHLEHHP